MSKRDGIYTRLLKARCANREAASVLRAVRDTCSGCMDAALRSRLLSVLTRCEQQAAVFGAESMNPVDAEGLLRRKRAAYHNTECKE